MSVLSSDAFVVGLVCGAVVGAAAVLAPRIVGLVFLLGSALIGLVLWEQGVPGLEREVGRLMAEALRRRELLIGTVVGLVCAATLADAALTRT